MILKLLIDFQSKIKHSKIIILYIYATNLIFTKSLV